MTALIIRSGRIAAMAFFLGAASAGAQSMQPAGPASLFSGLSSGGEGASGGFGDRLLGDVGQGLTGNRGLFGQGFDIAGDAIDATNAVFGPADTHFLGRQVAAGLIGARPVYPADALAAAYVSRIGAALALASSAPYQFDGYTFILVEDPDVNAFATPGGFVIMTTGMLGFLRDEDELAAVLGHEIGHVEMQHGLGAVSQAKALGVVGDVVDLGAEQAFAGSGAPVTRQLTEGAFGVLSDAIANGYSVDVESEADRRGMVLASAVGYDPYALVDVLERFRNFTGAYGGAGYPEQRGPDAIAFLERSGYARLPRPPARADRFAAALGDAGNWSAPALSAAALAAASPDSHAARGFASGLTGGTGAARLTRPTGTLVISAAGANWTGRRSRTEPRRAGAGPDRRASVSGALLISGDTPGGALLR